MNPFHFIAEVHSRGYTIIDAVSNGTTVRVVTDCVKAGQRYRVRRTSPLTDHPHMFEQFAAITSEDDVASFADQFGMLGIGAVPFDPRRPGFIGEQVNVWLIQAMKLKSSIDLARTHPRSIVSTGINQYLEDVDPKIIVSRSGPCLRFVPTNLLAAMWLQFALSIDLKREYRKCKNKKCSAWIEISSGDGGRTSKTEYCGDTCKHAAYRSRRSN